MNKYNIKNVETPEMLKALNKSYTKLAFEGVENTEENLNWLYDWLEKLGALKQDVVPDFYMCTGKLFSETYSLKISYPADLNILILDNINIAPTTLARFDIGGRWLDDIVDNNLAANNQSSYDDYDEDYYDDDYDE